MPKGLEGRSYAKCHAIKRSSAPPKKEHGTPTDPLNVKMMAERAYNKRQRHPGTNPRKYK